MIESQLGVITFLLIALVAAVLHVEKRIRVAVGDLHMLIQAYAEYAQSQHAEFVASRQAPTPVVESQPAVAFTQAPAPPRTDLCEVLHRQHGEWVHHSWVRQDSPACHEALRKNFRVRYPSGVTIEGGA